MEKRTINPENWTDNEVSYKIFKNHIIFAEEKFKIKKIVLQENEGTCYILNTGIGDITAYYIDGEWYALDSDELCSRTSNNQYDAIIKVLANIF